MTVTPPWDFRQYPVPIPAWHFLILLILVNSAFVWFDLVLVSMWATWADYAGLQKEAALWVGSQPPSEHPPDCSQADGVNPKKESMLFLVSRSTWSLTKLSNCVLDTCYGPAPNLAERMRTRDYRQIHRQTHTHAHMHTHVHSECWGKMPPRLGPTPNIPNG